MRRSLLVLAAALIALAAPGVSAPAGAAPDPTSVYVEAIVSGGTGCPQGTAAPSIGADGTHFTVALDSLVASTGPGVIGQNRKTCQLTVNLHLPSAVLSALTVELVIPGHVNLPAGTTAFVSSTAYVVGSVLQVSKSLAFSGPVAQDYELVHTVRVLDLLNLRLGTPGPCTNLLNFKTEARITGPSSSPAQLTVGSIDGTLASSSLLAAPC